MYEEDSRAWPEMWFAFLLIVIMYNSWNLVTETWLSVCASNHLVYR